MDIDEISSGLRAHVLLTTTRAINSKSKIETPKQPDSLIVDAKTLKRFEVLPEDSIDYGYFSNSALDSNDESFYITTAINYTNGIAHMGHAYEATTSDVIARYARLLKKRTWFLTGSDEHGQKIANAAASMNARPIEICDKYVKGFKNLLQRLKITNNDYVRTTSARHKQVAQELWKRCVDDIYLSTYEGWYLEREEIFVTDSDAELWQYKDPVSGVALKKVSEESYFFRMSKYHKKLLDHIKENPDFIQPDKHRNFILSRLESDSLRDLSISRTSFSWGISVPEGFDSRHVMYVWVDALSNYITGVDLFSDESSKKSFWPANVHIIGKDILWFHAVIWPCLLMSASISLPKQIFAHGFVNDAQGKKMSKSLGNVIDPHDMLDIYNVDTFRWYLCKEASFGSELSFSQMSIRLAHNSDLADVLGNLIHRMTNLCQKYSDSKVPSVQEDTNHKLPIDFHSIRKSYISAMNLYQLEQGSNIAIQGFRDVNLYLTTHEPWHKTGSEYFEFRQLVVRNTLEAVYALSHLLTPFLPMGAKNIFQKLNCLPIFLPDLNSNLRNLTVHNQITIGDILYQKIEPPQQNPTIIKPKPVKNAQTHVNEFSKMDMRVGEITKIWNHPSADKLFCEEISIGSEVRQVASGLRGHYTVEELLHKKIIVLCNLKPAKMVGFESCGMVLVAKDDSKAELVTPPVNSKVGERVLLQGISVMPDPYSSTQVKKKKTWSLVCKDLKTSQEHVAMYQNYKLVTSAGECTVPTLAGADIS